MPATARTKSQPTTVYYDGQCGLCHAAVRFLLRRDPGAPHPPRFRFAPLAGQHLRTQLTPDQIAALPDSIVVLTPNGQTLTRSDAALHLLQQLHQPYPLLARIGRWVPRPIRDWLYDRIAAIRHRFFKPPPAACPVVPPDQRDRFLP